MVEEMARQPYLTPLLGKKQGAFLESTSRFLVKEKNFFKQNEAQALRLVHLDLNFGTTS